MRNEINFFGLLHYQKNENLKLNFKSKSDKEKILVYLKNAIVLSEQLNKFGYKFELITNDKKYISTLLKKLNFSLNLRQISFKTFVPPNTHFYSCHYRVDVFQYLSNLKNSYSILIDLDVLILNKPINLIKNRNQETAFVNKITSNVLPAYGKKNILKTLKILNPKIKKVNWYGGDFFCGNSTFYKQLHERTKFYQKKFVENISSLSTQTDELFMSLAIEDIRKEYNVLDCAKNKTFTRYWNTNVKHVQKKIQYYLKFNILHIPADKLFLSRCYDELTKKNSFIDDYFMHVYSFRNIFQKVISKILPNIIKDKIKKYLSSKIH